MIEKEKKIKWMWSRLSKTEKLIMFGGPIFIVYIFYKMFGG